MTPVTVFLIATDIIGAALSIAWLAQVRSLFKRKPTHKESSSVQPKPNIASSLNRLDEHGRSQIGRLVTRETVHVPGSMPYVFIISIEDLPSDTITREGAA